MGCFTLEIYRNLTQRHKGIMKIYQRLNLDDNIRILRPFISFSMFFDVFRCLLILLMPFVQNNTLHIFTITFISTVNFTFLNFMPFSVPNYVCGLRVVFLKSFFFG